MAASDKPKLDLSIEDLLVNPDAIPSPPILVMNIIRLADSPDVSIAKLSKLVEQDAPLAATFVRMANSSLFSPSREITSVQRSLVVVGLRSVRILALSTSMQSLLPMTVGGAECAAARRRSLVNAIASKTFLDPFDRDLADQAFLAGLLGNVGLLALAIVAPDAYATLFEAAKEASIDPASGEEIIDPWPTAKLQTEILGFTTDELTARLTESWGLPQYISDAIRYRSPESERPAEMDKSTSLLMTGMELGMAAEAIICGNHAAEALFELLPTAQKMLDLEPEQVSETLIAIEPLIAETAGLLSFELPSGVNHAELLAEAMTKMQAMSLDAASALNRETQVVEQLSERNRMLETENRCDSLTSLLNRRGFDAILLNEAEHRIDNPEDDDLGLIVFDIDHFKHVNDTYGHQVGDEVLREIGQAFHRVSRRSEHVARQGGEEFALIMPHTSLREMKLAAERLRTEVADIVLFAGDQEVSLTISAGGAALKAMTSTDVLGDLYRRADEMLYKAKHLGRNQSIIDNCLLENLPVGGSRQDSESAAATQESVN